MREHPTLFAPRRECQPVISHPLAPIGRHGDKTGCRNGSAARRLIAQKARPSRRPEAAEPKTRLTPRQVICIVLTHSLCAPRIYFSVVLMENACTRLQECGVRASQEERPIDPRPSLSRGRFAHRVSGLSGHRDADRSVVNAVTGARKVDNARSEKETLKL